MRKVAERLPDLMASVAVPSCDSSVPENFSKSPSMLRKHTSEKGWESPSAGGERACKPGLRRPIQHIMMNAGALSHVGVVTVEVDPE